VATNGYELKTKMISSEETVWVSVV